MPLRALVQAIVLKASKLPVMGLLDMQPTPAPESPDLHASRAPRLLQHEEQGALRAGQPQELADLGIWKP